MQNKQFPSTPQGDMSELKRGTCSALPCFELNALCPPLSVIPYLSSPFAQNAPSSVDEKASADSKNEYNYLFFGSKQNV